MEFQDLKKAKPRYVPYGLTLFGPATVPKSDFKGSNVDFMIIRPGEKAALHIHKTGQEIYCILDGEGVIQVGEEKNPIHKDQAVYVPPNVPRRLENTGSEDFRILVILSPPFDMEDYEVIEKAVAEPWDEDHRRRYNEFWKEERARGTK